MFGKLIREKQLGECIKSEHLRLAAFHLELHQPADTLGITSVIDLVNHPSPFSIFKNALLSLIPA